MVRGMVKTNQVLVTGGSGFIGLHVVNQLLESGYCVNTTTRSLGSDAALPLKEMAEQYPGKLNIFEATLLEEGSFTESMRGVDAVFHLAAPVMVQSDDLYESQIRPAIEGTRNVLETCLRNPSVKTVVLTSSAFTVVSPTPINNHTYTEDDFTDPEVSPEMAYVVAKVQAEKYALNFAQQHRDKIRLICLNPVFVFGPEIQVKGTHGSLSQPRSNVGRDMALSFLCGAREAIPSGMIPAVDVRDVAVAHVRALEAERLEGRIIIHGSMIKWSEMAEILAKCVPKSKVPTIKHHTEEPCYTLDNAKSKVTLGMEYIPIEKSLYDLVHQITDYQ